MTGEEILIITPSEFNEEMATQIFKRVLLYGRCLVEFRPNSEVYAKSDGTQYKNFFKEEIKHDK